VASATPRRAPVSRDRRAFTGHALGTAAAIMAGGLVGPGPASAQDYPSSPVRMVVPFAPGGSTDIAARIVARKMGELLGRPVVVENKPGGGTAIGMGIVALAEPDGHTLLYGTNTLATNPALRRDLRYDTAKDLRPVGMAARQPFVLVVHPSVPADTVRQLVGHAKARPGAISFGSAGTGTGNHLALELFSILTGAEIQHVPYQGDGPMVTDLVAGRVQMTISTVASLLPQVRSGRLRALGVGGAEPLPQLPGVLPISEGGVPGYEASGWNAVLVPAGTRPGIVARLGEALGTALADPEVVEALSRSGAVPAYQPPEEMRAYLQSEIGRWGEVISARNIRLD
jgi:tripartite-type tricarboxylate transporter receptor subunit TctC